MHYLKYLCVWLFIMIPFGLLFITNISCETPLEAALVMISIGVLCFGSFLFSVLRRQREISNNGSGRMIRTEIYSEARKAAGTFAAWAVIVSCIAIYPEELNNLFGVTNLLPPDERLNGPNDWSLVIRTAIGVIVGVAAMVSTWRLLGFVFPTSVVGKKPARTHVGS